MFKFLANWQKERKLKAFRRQLQAINALAPTFEALSDEALKGKTRELREALDKGEPFESLLPQAFATVREAALRTLKLRPYDVQVLGGLALYRGAVAEMGTGEGKTLTAPFAAYAQFLQGRLTHISTANEYLAHRDALQMAPLYQFLGMRVGVVRAGQAAADKQAAYRCPVVYGVHHEFALDYLRDQLARTPEQQVQVALDFAIVDEADAALIDDARTPVVTTLQRAVDDASLAQVFDVARSLQRAEDAQSPGDFWVEGKSRTVVLTDSGYIAAHAQLSRCGLLPADSDDSVLYQPQHQGLVHRLVNALNALHLYVKDHHYVVAEGELVLVDELTGRLMPGRRWDTGLQQAVQLKEGLALAPEETVLGTISLQNYFRLYSKLAGMTGTATLEAEELLEFYGLDVVVVPPNKPSQRQDAPDRIFRTQHDKMMAVVQDVAERHAKGQPVLIGTASVEQSEKLHGLLSEMGLQAQLLNAKNHAQEAEIIAQAGLPGAITVTTNMAGRGVDIHLGGNVNLDIYRAQMSMGLPAWQAMDALAQTELVHQLKTEQRQRAEQVKAAGGLHIIGMERYESRRMDRQLRGRAARQGDPGSTCFYISLQDPLVENFAGETIRALFAHLDVKPGDDLEHALLTKTVDNAQRQAEGVSYQVRKFLKQYDDVLHEQRQAFYASRQEMLSSQELMTFAQSCLQERVDAVLAQWHQEGEPLNWDTRELSALGLGIEPSQVFLSGMDPQEVHEHLQTLVQQRMQALQAELSEEKRTPVLRTLILQAMDQNWFAHLEELAHLRKGIHLRGHAKEDPLRAYKKTAYEFFGQMLHNIKTDFVSTWAPRRS